MQRSMPMLMPRDEARDLFLDFNSGLLDIQTFWIAFSSKVKEGPQNSEPNLAAILSSTTWNEYKYIAVVSGEGISGIRNKAVKLKK